MTTNGAARRFDGFKSRWTCFWRGHRLRTIFVGEPTKLICKRCHKYVEMSYNQYIAWGSRKP